MKKKLLVILIIFISITCFDMVFLVRWLDSLKNYEIFANGILFPLSGLLFTSIPLLFLTYTNDIYPENTTDLVSTKDLIIIGLCDGLGSIIQGIPTPYLPVVTISIFNRLSLVFLLPLSKIYLGKKYSPNHYLGVFLTLYSVFLSFIPKVLDNKTVGNWWLLLYIVGIIPGVCSFIYKEKRLRGDPDIWWFNTWVSIYQLGWGLLFLPFQALLNKVTFMGFWKQIGYGFVCQFAGKNMLEGDNCQYGLLWFFLFNFLCTIMNALMLVIIREGSSVLFIIINTVKTPITAFLGSFKALAGNNVKKLTIVDLFVFIGLIMSSIVYNWKEEEEEPEQLFQPLNNFEEYKMEDNQKKIDLVPRIKINHEQE